MVKAELWIQSTKSFELDAINSKIKEQTTTTFMKTTQGKHFFLLLIQMFPNNIQRKYLYLHRQLSSVQCTTTASL